MDKFYGKVGFAETKETAPDVFVEQVVEGDYYGDVIRNIRRLQNSDGRNDDLAINNQISIVADPYAVQNFHSIRYVRWLGSAWKVTSVTVQFPRLVLELGGKYNGEQA